MNWGGISLSDYERTLASGGTGTLGPWVAFDIETANLATRDEAFIVACGAASDPWGGVRHWYSWDEVAERPRTAMDGETARDMLRWLRSHQRAGARVVAWNGASFDLKWLGLAAADTELATAVALDSYDPMFQMVMQRGFPVSLSNTCLGMGMTERKSMAGEDAPDVWRSPDYVQVLEYVAGDVQMTAEVAQRIETARGLTWITKRGLRSTEPMARLLTVREALALPHPDQSWMDEPIDVHGFTAWMDGGSVTDPEHEYYRFQQPFEDADPNDCAWSEGDSMALNQPNDSSAVQTTREPNGCEWCRPCMLCDSRPCVCCTLNLLAMPCACPECSTSPTRTEALAAALADRMNEPSNDALTEAFVEAFGASEYVPDWRKRMADLWRLIREDELLANRLGSIGGRNATLRALETLMAAGAEEDIEVELIEEWGRIRATARPKFGRRVATCWACDLPHDECVCPPRCECDASPAAARSLTDHEEPTW